MLRRFELHEDDGKVIGEGVVFPTGIVVVEITEVPALVTYPSVEVMEAKVATSRWKVEWEHVWVGSTFIPPGTPESELERVRGKLIGGYKADER
jgi:hypothetical protein